MTRRIISWIAIAATAAPFAFLILGAMSDSESIARLDFSQASLSNLNANLEGIADAGILQAMTNTLAICIPMVLLQCASSVLAAYAFAFFDFKRKRLLYTLIIGSYLIPAVATLVPLYFVMTAAGLKGSPAGILLPFALYSPYAVALLRERFEAVPREILDQARIDGLGSWSLLIRVVLPISKSFVTLLAVITFISTWNAYLWPRLIAGTEWPTITVAIAGLQSQYDSHWNLVLSAALLAVIPALIAFALSRRNLVRNPLAEIEI